MRRVEQDHNMSKIDTFPLGDAIYLEDKLSVPTPTSVTISIENQNGSKVVTDEDMTKLTDYIYYYIYQSTKYDNGGIEGEYIAEITAIYGGYSSVKTKKFNLLKTFN